MAPLHLISTCLLLATGPSLPTVAIDLRPLDRPTFEALQQAGIYEGVVVRLVHDGVALVDAKERADIVLRMEPGAGPAEVLVTASVAAGSRSRRVSIRNLAQEEVRLELIHSSVELVRQVQALPRPGAPRLRARVELDGGVLWSAGSPGVLTRLAGGMRVGPGEVDLGLVVHRPLGLSSGLNVIEWGLLAGVSTGELPVGSRGLVAAGLDLGVWQHRWTWSGPSADSGSRFDGAALLHGEAALRLGAHWRVGLGAGALFTLHERAHRTPSEQLWKAPRVRPFAGLLVGFGHEVGN